MISSSERRNCVKLITTARKSGARLSKACEIVGIHERTFQRWTQCGSVMHDQRLTAVRPEPANKLNPVERQAILDVCHQPDYASLPPSQFVPRMADDGIYIASESTFYRVLHEGHCEGNVLLSLPHPRCLQPKNRRVGSPQRGERKKTVQNSSIRLLFAKGQ